MEFIDKLEVLEQSSGFLNSKNTFRLFRQISFKNNISLSVQASYAHYCTPRTTVDVEDYETMELVIFKDGDFSPAISAVYDPMLLKDLEEYYDGQIFAFVPVSIIERLYQHLKANY